MTSAGVSREGSGRESLQARSERLAEKTFLGGPVHDFERVGRLTLEVLLSEGMGPTSRVLDVGCGALRLGYWLMRLLDPGCYHGIEPNRRMLAIGLEELVEPDVVERAQARFAHNDDFDFSSVGGDFDYVVARSIWTHASKSQIAAMLASFAATSAAKGVFLATYHPTSALSTVRSRWPRAARQLRRPALAPAARALARMPAFGAGGDYEGAGWVGRSHECGERGLVQHSLRWISAEAAEHGLTVEPRDHPVVNHQHWLRVRRA